MAENKTVWQMFVDKIESGSLNLWAGEQEIIWQGQTKSVKVICNSYRQLFLAVNGVYSAPIAYNGQRDAATLWRLVPNAQGVYQNWVSKVK